MKPYLTLLIVLGAGLWLSACSTEDDVPLPTVASLPTMTPMPTATAVDPGADEAVQDTQSDQTEATEQNEPIEQDVETTNDEYVVTGIGTLAYDCPSQGCGAVAILEIGTRFTPQNTVDGWHWYQRADGATVYVRLQDTTLASEYVAPTPDVVQVDPSATPIIDVIEAESATPLPSPTPVVIASPFPVRPTSVPNPVVPPTSPPDDRPNITFPPTPTIPPP